MCGIAGFSISTAERPTLDRYRLAQTLLREIEPRGRDAAGAAWRTAGQGRTWYQKDAVRGSIFAGRLNESIGQAAAAVLHTRFATQGSVKQDVNNHPIVRDGIVGVHNGVIANDDEIFALLGEKVERYGQVDSEAIFALIEQAEAMTAGDESQFADLFSLLVGTMAAAWLPTDQRELWLVRGSGSPLYAAQTERRSLIFASTESAIRVAARAVGLKIEKILAVREGTVLRVVGGRVTHSWAFAPESGGIRPRRSYYGNGISTHRTTLSAPTPKSKSKSKSRRKHRHGQQTFDLPEGTVVRRWNDGFRLDADVDPYAYDDDEWDDGLPYRSIHDLTDEIYHDTYKEETTR